MTHNRQDMLASSSGCETSGPLIDLCRDFFSFYNWFYGISFGFERANADVSPQTCEKAVVGLNLRGNFDEFPVSFISRSRKILSNTFKENRTRGPQPKNLQKDFLTVRLPCPQNSLSIKYKYRCTDICGLLRERLKTVTSSYPRKLGQCATVLFFCTEGGGGVWVLVKEDCLGPNNKLGQGA